MGKKMAGNVLEILSFYKKLVWPEIKKYLKSPTFPSAFKIPEDYKSLEKFHWKMSCEYPERQGKYLRPTLLMLTTVALDGNKKRALKTASAMQLSQEWLLIHDALHAVMWKILIDNLVLLGARKTSEIIDEFYSMISRTILGQTVDIKWFKENKLDFSDDDWYFVADSKSSYYTITGPMRLGAIIAGANSKQLKLLTKFGLELGRCFQLVDDILDVTSDFGGLKHAGNDIFEGKRTILLGHLLRIAKLSDKKKIFSILEKKREKKTNKEVVWIIKKMYEYKSVDYAKGLAKSHKEKALQIFDKELDFLFKQPARDNLKLLTNFILERDH
jgi:geranylgeranyl diphosphate synthase type II